MLKSEKYIIDAEFMTLPICHDSLSIVVIVISYRFIFSLKF